MNTKKSDALQIEQELKKRKQWPYAEALKILKRHRFSTEQVYTLETGFGPSGLPHIGTFGEVVRTEFIRSALKEYGFKTRLISFSDDLDGLRKVPENMPGWLKEHLGKPVSSIPDPFGKEESFSAHMNSRLRKMLDDMGVEYEFHTSKESYRGGCFNEGIITLLDQFHQLEEIIAPTLSADTLASWYPFFPLCTKCGKVMTTRVLSYSSAKHTAEYICDKPYGDFRGCGNHEEISVLSGGGKMTWRVDWPLRWFALGIDYELYGKDLIDSFKIGQKIMRRIFRTPEPENMFYEMFLDEDGSKISKSKGSGLTVEEWLRYGSYDSLVYLMYKMPKKAKELSHRIIPQYAGEVNTLSADLFAREAKGEVKEHAFRFVRFGRTGSAPLPQVSYSLICNLLSALKTDDISLLKTYLFKIEPSLKEANEEELNELLQKALNFYNDLYEKEGEVYHFSDTERKALQDLIAYLRVPREDVQELHDTIFTIARSHGLQPGAFFKTLYHAIVHHERGPKLATFILTIGQEKTISLIEESLQKEEV